MQAHPATRSAVTARAGAVLLAALLLVITGCGVAPRARATPRPSPTVSRAQLCHDLAERQIDQCPPIPISFDRDVEFQNEVGGRVSHSTAAQWEQAFLRGDAYYLWAYKNAKAQFLLSGALGPPHIAQTDLFRGELQDIANAQQAGGRLELKPLSTSAVALLATPVALKQTAADLGTVWEPWAFLVLAKGPASAKVVLPNGSVRTLWNDGPGSVNEGLSWGYFKRDPILGPVWYNEGFVGCAGSPPIAKEFATLS